MPSAVPTFGKNIFVSLFAKLPVFLVKFPFFVVAAILYTITGLTTFSRFVFTVLFGFTNIDFSVDGVKSSQSEKLAEYKPKRGDLIVSNYISPLDGYLFTLLSGTSNIVILVPDKAGDLYKYSPSALSDHCFGFATGSKVDDVSKLKNRIVFLLLEGTPSNNKAILPFIKLNPRYSFDEFTIKSLVVRLSPVHLTLPIPHVGKLQYLFELMTNLSQKTVRNKIYKFDTFNVSQIRRSFESNSLSPINQDLDIDAKNRFVSYYFDHSIKK
ncbi:LOA1 Lysophosphatidic acid:oleoyl-CoA acyltransferase 1 [Candida maltosa Xu316]